MARVVVDVMLEPEILDRRDRRCSAHCPVSASRESRTFVRERFELEVEGPVDDAALARS